MDIDADYSDSLYDLTRGLQQFQNYQSKSGCKTVSIVGSIVSEKYDGIRAVYLGKGRLVTAKGDLIRVPEWFIRQFPDNVPLDGELFIGRERFNHISGIVRSRHTEEKVWRSVKFMVFDIPVSDNSLPIKGKSYSELDFETRQQILREIIGRDQPNIELVEQHLVENQSHFDQFYKQIVDEKGEGVIISAAKSLYGGGKRVNHKYKPVDDAEAVVIGYRQGNGKNTGLVGSLGVLTVDKDGEVSAHRSYNIGTGLTAYQRVHARTLYPPGTVVVCQFNGYTSGGIPRFPRLKGIRADMEVQLDPKYISADLWMK